MITVLTWLFLIPLAVIAAGFWVAVLAGAVLLADSFIRRGGLRLEVRRGLRDFGRGPTERGER